MDHASKDFPGILSLVSFLVFSIVIFKSLHFMFIWESLTAMAAGFNFPQNSEHKIQAGFATNKYFPLVR